MFARLPRSGRTVRQARSVAVAALLVTLLHLWGCDVTGGALKEAVAVIDNGIASIEQNSASWQEILQRVANQLPNEVSETIRVEAQSLANRSVGTVGVEFRCNVDFLADRAIASLQRLKAELLGRDPPVLPPAFCTVDPSSIDLKVSPETWSTAVLFGYDLDHQDPDGKQLEFALLTGQGGSVPLPESRVGRTSHYQITLNLGNMARQLYQDGVTKIVSSWDGDSDGHPQIVVVPWEPTRQKITEPVGATGPIFPPRVAGDADFDTDDDEPTDLEVRGEIAITAQAVQVHYYMYAREVESDYTTVEGWSDWEAAYNAPEGWRILEVRPSAPSVRRARVTEHGRLTYNQPAGEVVEYFEVYVDRDGDEAGSWSRVTTYWRPLEITIEEVVPPWLR